MTVTTYTGRFAPTPSGPLHFGSLLAAIASYLQARAAGGHWLLRIEDIDPPRQQRGADRLICNALEAFGFAWHGPLTYQSARREAQLFAARQLLQGGLAYRCSCSRNDLADARHGPLGPIHPDECAAPADPQDYAVRLRTNDRAVAFEDLLQGPVSQQLRSESGDFVILRRDGLVAYHLAVAVDDAYDGITEIVRGIDLLDSTPRQIHLQRLLELPTPRYAHIPVAVNAQNQKLSKRSGATALPPGEPRPTLIAALRALQLPVPADLADCRLDEIWDWAVEHWRIDRLRNQRTIELQTDPLAQAQNGLS